MRSTLLLLEGLLDILVETDENAVIWEPEVRIPYSSKRNPDFTLLSEQRALGKGTRQHRCTWQGRVTIHKEEDAGSTSRRVLPSLHEPEVKAKTRVPHYAFGPVSCAAVLHAGKEPRNYSHLFSTLIVFFIRFQRIPAYFTISGTRIRVNLG